ncbi:hypothetical protein IQ07DRAFT_525516 [Pyrenochaeta sp. DS3sAY3a]|nr:hypothetical protein IQ07DRAFT_525516 [Pyrenochaeta sp. DS3sAY3a]
MKEQIRSEAHTSIDYQSLEFLAAGGSGIVYAIDKNRILKEYHNNEGADVERRAFERLGSHMNIVRCLGTTENGLILERGQPLRQIISEMGAEARLRRFVASPMKTFYDFVTLRTTLALDVNNFSCSIAAHVDFLQECGGGAGCVQEDNENRV